MKRASLLIGVAVAAVWMTRRSARVRSRIEQVQRACALLPAAARAVEWDYAGLLRLIEAWCDRAAAHHAAHRLTSDWQQMVRELRLAAELCRRIRNPPYLSTLGYNSDYLLRKEPRRITLRNAGISRVAHAQREADFALLLRLLRRKLRSWWD